MRSDIARATSNDDACACTYIYSQVLMGPLEQRGFTTDMVDILATDHSNAVPLSLSTESAQFAGSTLCVRGAYDPTCLSSTSLNQSIEVY